MTRVLSTAMNERKFASCRRRSLQRDTHIVIAVHFSMGTYR